MSNRQVTRQIEAFLDDGLREHLIVALAILDGTHARIAAGIRQYCSDLNTELAYHKPTRDTTLKRATDRRE